VRDERKRGLFSKEILDIRSRLKCDHGSHFNRDLSIPTSTHAAARGILSRGNPIALRN